jgi:hypothetical protein
MVITVAEVMAGVAVLLVQMAMGPMAAVVLRVVILAGVAAQMEVRLVLRRL